MKLALLIKPGFKQFVVTPESDEERSIMQMITVDETVPFLVKRGSFFHKCRGGWEREFQDDDSIMLVFAENQEKEEMACALCGEPGKWICDKCGKIGSK